MMSAWADFERELAARPRVRSEVLPGLLLAQARLGHVSDEALRSVAQHVGLTENETDGIATGYRDLRRRPTGAHPVRVCTGPACWAAGGERLLREVEQRWGVRVGETTSDGQLTLEEAECCFMCAVAPVVEVDGVGHGRATSAVSLSAARPLALGGRTQAPVRLLVAAGGCGTAVGARDVLAALRGEVDKRGLAVDVVEAGCTGRCFDAVEVTLTRPGLPEARWGRLTIADAARVVDVAAGESPPPSADQPNTAGQQRVLLEWAGRVDPIDADEALARGVYAGLRRALARAPDEVIDEVKRSGLSGRGGAYFPTGLKWEACRAGGEAPRYLVVNAEEGEPGVFKDRHLLEGDPHRVIEGALIAAYAIGAEDVFVYVNGQASLAIERLRAALRAAVSSQVLGSTWACRVEVREGGGGYVLGEETVLLESIEGRRPMPRVRPPQPTTAGLWGRPTVINNVETLANVPLILERGAEWFRRLGSPRHPGTKLVAVTGDVMRPGLVEVSMGTPLRDVLDLAGGGIPDGRTCQAVLSGGPSGEFTSADDLDLALEPRTPGLLLGSGNLLVLAETRSIGDLVQRLARFNAEESCGKCTPCREGTRRLVDLLDHGYDRVELEALSEIVGAASLCGLGRMAPGPILSALRLRALPEERDATFDD
jgi:NADH:ubiquinone oxidoreductase subunit F (NADH-binding)/NADH:ubiquinone oxidoreductase subunit E